MTRYVTWAAPRSTVSHASCHSLTASTSLQMRCLVGPWRCASLARCWLRERRLSFSWTAWERPSSCRGLARISSKFVCPRPLLYDQRPYNGEPDASSSFSSYAPSQRRALLVAKETTQAESHRQGRNPLHLEHLFWMQRWPSPPSVYGQSPRQSCCCSSRVEAPYTVPRWSWGKFADQAGCL